MDDVQQKSLRPKHKISTQSPLHTRITRIIYRTFGILNVILGTAPLITPAQAQVDFPTQSDPMDTSPGTYLPQNQLIPGVCRIVIKGLRIEKTPIRGPRDGTPIGPPIIQESDNDRLCSGSLIGPTTILTARHCNLYAMLDKYPRGNVVVGTNTSGKEQFYIQKVSFKHLESQCVVDPRTKEYETRITTEEQTWPQPGRNPADRGYDVMILKTSEPFVKTPLISVDLNAERVRETALNAGK